MIEAVIRAALKQRVVVLVIAIALTLFGAMSLKQVSVDAFPDVTNIQVQIATEAPGRSPEEVERFVIAPRQARRFLRGESPRRARASHPPVSSLASVAESLQGGEQDGRSVDRESCRP